MANVPKAKELFDQASEILGYDLLQVCVEGALPFPAPPPPPWLWTGQSFI